MKILVTGGAGFIGSHLCEALRSAEHEVWAVDNLSTGFRENISDELRFLEADIRNESTAQWVAITKFDAIFHLAAQLDVRKSVSDPVFDADVNVIGSLRLLEAAAKSGVTKFIFASSGGTVYGEQDYFPADEAHPCRPLSPYGITKLTVERYLYYYEQAFGLPTIALRYANIYGMRQSPHGEAGVVAIFAKKMLQNETPVINGDGLQTRDYLFIEDLISANLAALNTDARGVFNVGSGIETDVVTLFKATNAILGGKTPLTHGPAKTGEQRRSVIDYSAFRRATGWAPRYNIESGLTKTLAWFQARYGV